MLLIDAGNSRIKWALVENGTWMHPGVADPADGEMLRESFLGLPQPGRILVSNVAGGEAERHIRTACAAWPCPAEFIVAAVNQCGVRNCYEQPGRLGSDRWAALIAAWHGERGACLVVNCGTATTIDALSARGEFIGGLILPGMEMMRQSLAEGTARLTREKGKWRKFPLNTPDAVFSGAIQATAGAIRQQLAALAANDARCVLSGGAADCVQPYLDVPLARVDNLVLRGLQIIGQETGL